MDENERLYFLLGYIHAKAEEISKEFGRPIEDVKKILYDDMLKGYNKPPKENRPQGTTYNNAKPKRPKTSPLREGW